MRLTWAPSGVAVELPDALKSLAEEHASGMLDGNELLNLAGALALFPALGGGRDLVVEIGAYEGRTAVFMARALRALGRGATVLSIDPFERVSPDPLNPQGSYGNYLTQVRDAGLEDVCLPLIAFSQHAAAAVPDRIGVLVVDGDHHYASVRSDLELYVPKLVPGGFVFVDDYVPVYADVQKAADEYLAAHAELALLHKSHFLLARAEHAVDLAP